MTVALIAEGDRVEVLLASRRFMVRRGRGAERSGSACVPVADSPSELVRKGSGAGRRDCLGGDCSRGNCIVGGGAD